MSLPQIDPYDRQFILMLADFAASTRRLCEVTTDADALRAYLTSMTGHQLAMDRAVEAAIRRAGA
jgi:hypothetical protein